MISMGRNASRDGQQLQEFAQACLLIETQHPGFCKHALDHAFRFLPFTKDTRANEVWTR
jgi:hypothetical protein